MSKDDDRLPIISYLCAQNKQTPKVHTYYINK